MADSVVISHDNNDGNQENEINKTTFKNANIPEKIRKFFKRHWKVFALMAGIIIGLLLGIILKINGFKNDDKLVMILAIFGQLFIRSLNLFVLPIVFLGVVSATSKIDRKTNAELSAVCFAIVILTHIVACLFGICGSQAFNYLAYKEKMKTTYNQTTNITESITSVATTNINNQKPQRDGYDIFADIVRNLIPKNIIKATMYQELTEVKQEPSKEDPSKLEKKRSVVSVSGTNMLGILVFAILVGIATGAVGKAGDSFKSFVESLNTIITRVLNWLILFAPIGVGSLVFDAIFDIRNLNEMIANLGLLVLMIAIVSLIYGTLFLSGFCLIATRGNIVNVLKYYKVFASPSWVAFSTTSGVICIPKAIEACERHLNMNPHLSRFCIPVYTALQSDGSAIYVTMCTIFLAFLNKVTLSFGDYAIILIMTTILMLSLPSVPSSSLVTILVVLSSIDLSYLNIGILYALEWILDRIRTMINVYSHCVCTVITAKIFKEKFQDIHHHHHHHHHHNHENGEANHLHDDTNNNKQENGHHTELVPLVAVQNA